MRFDATTKKQAEDLSRLFTEFFGKTRAFKQAASSIFKLLMNDFDPRSPHKSVKNIVGITG